MGHEVKAEKRNWYMEDALGEKRIGHRGQRRVLQHYLVFALLVLRVACSRAACHERAFGAAR